MILAVERLDGQKVNFSAKLLPNPAFRRLIVEVRSPFVKDNLASICRLTPQTGWICRLG